MQHIISQTGADALLSQLTRGLLTPDEYHAAIDLVEPLREEGMRCTYCDKAATIGQTCATHTDPATAMNAARAARPIVDQSRCGTREALITAVMTALELIGREKPAGRFAERAEKAPGMNALCMIAREYVKLVNQLGVPS
jgi:hypothetical protein